MGYLCMCTCVGRYDINIYTLQQVTDDKYKVTTRRRGS